MCRRPCCGEAPAPKRFDTERDEEDHGTLSIIKGDSIIIKAQSPVEKDQAQPPVEQDNGNPTMLASQQSTLYRTTSMTVGREDSVLKVDSALASDVSVHRQSQTGSIAREDSMVDRASSMNLVGSMASYLVSKRDTDATTPSRRSRNRRTSSVAEVFPMYGIQFETLMEMVRFKPFHELKEVGAISHVSEQAIVHFLSHEWLSLRHPDPQGIQIGRLQDVLRKASEGRVDLIFEPKDWQAFAEKASTSTKGVVRKEESDFVNECLTESGLQTHVTTGEYWLDYWSIPQRAEFGDLHEFKAVQKAAIRSIPAYLDRCNYFWVLAPTARHVDKGTLCSFGSWRSRGWCRLEEFGNCLSGVFCLPLIITSAPKLRTFGFIDFIFMCQGKPHMAPCAGAFTCCRLGHLETLANGKTEIGDCDKEFILQVLNMMLKSKMQQVRQGGVFQQLRTMMTVALEPMLFGGAPTYDASSYLPPEEKIGDFLERLAMESTSTVVGTAPNQHTAWTHAAWLGHVSMLEKLQHDEGAKRIMQDACLRDALAHRACMQGHTSVITFLLERDIIPVSALSRTEGSQGITPLDRAAKYGFPEMVALLLSRSVEVEPIRGDGSTPLHSAAGAGHRECCRLLLQGRSNVNAVDHAGRTPLHLAADPLSFYGAAEGKEVVIGCLLDFKADPRLADKSGQTALQLAQAANFLQGLDILADSN